MLSTALMALALLCACSGEARTAVATSSTTPTTQVAERRDLSIDEALGGHTLAKHVGKTDEELRARLVREGRISASSSYTDRETAEGVVGQTLRLEAERISRWIRRGPRRTNLALEYHGDAAHPVGRTIRRGNAPRACADAIVVLRAHGDNGYYVLTSYPECR